MTEIKVAKSWNKTLDEWVTLPRWVRRFMYAEYVVSGDIAYWVAEDAKNA